MPETARGSAPKQGAWTTPGLHFEQCTRKPKTPTQLLQRAKHAHIRQEEALFDRVICPSGQMPIGNYGGDVYNFTCCDAGQQCGGCRKIKNGMCQECAAGYVHQQIPILNITKCFLCDDISGWQDSRGLTCHDYELKGSCIYGIIEAGEDKPFHGVRPSEACCACGGGSLQATPGYMSFTNKAVVYGYSVDAFPEPQALGTQVESCNLAKWSLNLTGRGRIQGVVVNSSESSSDIKCTLTLTQDPIRGLFTTVSVDVPVGEISYGEQVLVFKYWGLDSEPTMQNVPIQHTVLEKGHALENFQLHCNCPWLNMSSNGTLVPGPLPTPLQVQGPSLSGYDSIPSCSCQVTADEVRYNGTLREEVEDGQKSTSFTVLQGRLWKAGAYKIPVLHGRVGTALLNSQLQEHVSGMHWSEEHEDLKLPVLQNISSGELFVVSPALVPEVLDVQCSDDSNATYTWSRITGDIMRRGEVAFSLDPSAGTVSGTPRLDLSAEGRGSLQINCSVALGGQLYDKVLPVAKLTVDLVDDTCWVPTNISGWFGWKPMNSSKSCMRLCRQSADCAAVQVKEDGTCRAVVTGGEKETFAGQVLTRLENCSEDDTRINLTAAGAWYVQGSYYPANIFKDQVSYSHAGITSQLQFHLIQKEFAEMQVPKVCDNASWLLVHINSSDFQNGSVKAPEFFGTAMACIDGDVVHEVFVKGYENFELEFLPSELNDTAILEPQAEQQAELRLSVPSCDKPDLTDFVFGTLEDPEHYSLHSCECFGEAHAQTSPVTAHSDVEASRSGNFNNGTVEDQLISQGPYTCEDASFLDQTFDTTQSACAETCHSSTGCAFYLFFDTGKCILFKRCQYLQQFEKQVVATLYGVPPAGDFCLIADPETCWKEIKRRSYLSLTPSNVPRCLFQDQYEACDMLQQLSGQEAGSCSKCQYIDASSEYAAKGMQKVPLPTAFPAASQISVSCNYTSRMFTRLDDSLKWEGPRATASFTCVSGQWVGELGAWQHLDNLSCQDLHLKSASVLYMHSSCGG
ncbi:unnamed protein product [Symbiodinium sp. CCMP2592]|nr:unnamed protein product [Symbiodinium sp. CCMP2592]